MTHARKLLARAAAVGIVCVATAPATFAQLGPPPAPDRVMGVGVEEHPDALLPPDLKFKDEEGREIALGSFFDKPGRPVLLTLNYYRCPMLCTVQLNGLVDGLKGLGWTPGAEFRIVTVSIDPGETPDLAREKKRSYLASYHRPEAAEGWRFLTGNLESIRSLVRTIGFNYKLDAETNQYAHVAAMVAVTPEGRISRYLYGVQFPAQTLRLALVEASEGRVGSALDRVILYCYHYDPKTGAYAPAAMTFMRIGGGLIALILAAGLAALWVRERTRRRAAFPEGSR